MASLQQHGLWNRVKHLSVLSTPLTGKLELQQTVQDTGCFLHKHRKNESLPPTSDSLSHHINRANYQAYVWKRSLCKDQDLPSPETNGWVIEDDNLITTLMTKDPTPVSLVELTICKCSHSACKRDHLSSAGQTEYLVRKLVLV